MSKRQREFHSIKELMQEVFKENKLEKGMQQLSVKDAWEKLMGKGIVSYTNSVELQGSTLVVKLRSSVLREELSYGKEKIITMLNEELGKELITKVILA